MGTPPGGPGIWDTANGYSNWYNGSTYTQWTNAPGDEAVFGGEAGTIYIRGGGVTAQATHYTAPGTSYQLNTVGSTFAWGAGGTVDVQGSNLFVLSTTTGSDLKKTGTGTLAFYVGTSGTPSGTWDIQAGTFAIKSDITGTTNRGINLSGAGSVFDLGHSTISTSALSGIGEVRFGSNIVVGTTSGGRYQINSDGSSSTFGGKFTGFGRAEKRGPGVLTLTGTQNTFQGNWTVQGGMIINGGDTLPDNFPTFIQATSTLTINNNETIGSLGASSPTAANTAIVLNGGTLSIGSNAITAGNNQFPGQFIGSGLIKKIGSNVQLLATGGTTGTLTGSLGYSGKWAVEGGLLAVAPTTGDQILGVAPTALQADHITINGGTFAGSLTSTGSAQMALNANRGITVGANGGGLSMYSSTLTSILTVNGPITGSAGLNKGGGAVVFVNSDNAGTYSGAWNVVDGALGTSTTNANSSPFGTGGITVTGSALEILPGGTGGTPVVNAGNFTYGAGAQLQVNKGTNTNATLNLGTFNRGTDGSLMMLVGSGVANLGTAAGETIKATGVTNVNDVVPGVVAWTGAASNTADFVRYDATNGFVAATYNTTDINTANVSGTDTVSQTASGTMAAATAVNALRIGNGGTTALDLGGNTLTVGSGSNPAAIAINPLSTISNGTVNFGGRPAVVNVAPTATPTTGVTFTNATSFTKTGSGVLGVNTPMSYSGATYIASGSILLGANEVIPDTSDVVLTGSSPLNSLGSLAVNGFTETVRSISGDTQADMNFGLNGKIRIIGSANTFYNGGAAQTAGSSFSTFENAGTGKITFGYLSNPSSTGGVGLQGKAMSYGKMWVTGGGTVVINNTNYIPNASTTGVVPDAYYLDNGSTLEIGTSQLSSLSISAAGASTAGLTGFNRGIQIGAGGGTIKVTRYEEIVIAFQHSGIRSLEFT